MKFVDSAGKVCDLDDIKHAIVKPIQHPDTHCAVCQVPLVPEHAHMKCPRCGRRDSCCM